MWYSIGVMRTTKTTQDGKGGTMTTAQLRQMAAAAEMDFDWTTAARLFREAEAVYPARVGQLADADRAALLERASNCDAMASIMEG